MKPGSLAWVSGFWRETKGYIHYREEDGVVIIPPNLVYKTNDTGIAILKFLDGGGRLDRLARGEPKKAGDIEAFMSDIRSLYLGEAVETESIPYDFDFSRLPILGEIAVTYRCNNRCEFCYAGCGGGSGCSAPLDRPGSGDARKEMDAGEVRRVIDIFAAEAKIPFFSFTGGEPLLREDLEDFMRYAASKGLRVNLITNGTLATPERAKSLYDAGLRTAQVSLESPEPAIHDELCGSPGSHARTLAGIKALQAAGIAVQTNTTITAFNRGSLAAMPAYLASLGVARFSMNLYIPDARSEYAKALFVPYSEIGETVDAIRAAAKRERLVFFWYSPTPLCIFNPIARGLGNKSCAAADGLISVNPYGEVLPCSSYPEPLGNLLEKPFKEVWFSQRAGHFKQKRYAPESCRDCSAFTACQAACPLYWNYAGYEELKHVGQAPGISRKKDPVASEV